MQGGSGRGGGQRATLSRKSHMQPSKLRPNLISASTPRYRLRKPSPPRRPSPCYEGVDSPNETVGKGEIPRGTKKRDGTLMCITAIRTGRPPVLAGYSLSPSQRRMSNGRPLTPVGRCRPLVPRFPASGNQYLFLSPEFARLKSPRSPLRLKSGLRLARCARLRANVTNSPAVNSSMVQGVRLGRGFALDRTKEERKQRAQTSMGRGPGMDLWEGKPAKRLRSSSGISAWDHERHSISQEKLPCGECS